MSGRVLVLGGGGGKGAFQAGALETLATRGYEWSKILGSSVGALNGAMVATGQQGALWPVWHQLSEDQVQSGGPSVGRAIQLAFGWKRSIYDLDPLRELLVEYLEGAELETPFGAGVVDLETGAFGYNLLGNLVDDVWASATMPLIWAPVEGRYVDGGLRNIAPMVEALEADPDEIVVVLCSPLSVEPGQASDPKIWDDAQRVVEILTNEVYRNDVAGFLARNHLLSQVEGPLFNRDGRELEYVPVTVIAPAGPIGDTMDFSAETASRLWLAGRERARQALDKRTEEKDG